MFNYTVKSENYKFTRENMIIPRQKKVIEEFSESPREISLVSGREDFAAFQVLLGSDEAFTLNTGDTYYLSQYPMEKINYRVKFDFPLSHEIFHEYHVTEKGIAYNDMLSPIDTRDYPERAVCALFIHIPVPKNTEPGEYSGKVKIYAQKLFDDETLVGEISVNLSVKSFIFPTPKNRKFYLDLWQNITSIARHADVPVHSDAHFEVLEKYTASMQRLGQRALTLAVSEVPWGGQDSWDVENKGNIFQYSIVDVKKNKDGIFEYDFTKMQRYIDLGAKYGIKDELSLYGIVNVWGGILGKPVKEHTENMRVRYLDETSGTYRFMREVSELDGYIKALEDYFVKTNQISKVRIVADEPTDVEKFKKSVEHIHSIAPAFRFKAAIVEPSFIEEFGDLFDDFVPILDCVTNKFDTLSKYIKEMPEKRYLWYVCCGPEHPNMFLKSPLEESSLIGILTSYFRLDGFLRWNYTVWPENPRECLDYRPNWAAGDMNYVYPGHNGEPLLSLRYFALLRGIMFYELLETIRRKKGARVYNALIKEIIRPKAGCDGKVYNFYNFEMPKDEELSAFYAKLLDCLC